MYSTSSKKIFKFCFFICVHNIFFFFSEIHIRKDLKQIKTIVPVFWYENVFSKQWNCLFKKFVIIESD